MNEPFLTMCLSRSRTDLALFHRAQVMRLYELAGHRLCGHLPEWMTVRAPIVAPLVAMARARVA